MFLLAHSALLNLRHSLAVSFNLWRLYCSNLVQIKVNYFLHIDACLINVQELVNISTVYRKKTDRKKIKYVEISIFGVPCAKKYFFTKLYALTLEINLLVSFHQACHINISTIGLQTPAKVRKVSEAVSRAPEEERGCKPSRIRVFIIHFIFSHLYIPPCLYVLYWYIGGLYWHSLIRKFVKAHTTSWYW